MNSTSQNTSTNLIPFALMGLCALFLLSIITLLSVRALSIAIGNTVEHLLEEQLVGATPLPHNAKADAIYVLGGEQGSLKHRYAKAADLYHKAVSHKILILSRPGITQYSPELKRNLTNDEWSLMTLEKLGVPQNAIETTRMKGGFFGTLREGKAISSLFEERNYKKTILISSPYHTRRVKLSFQKLLEAGNVEALIQGSSEKASILSLISEFIKLKVYTLILLL